MPNVISSPRFFKNKLVIAKAEATVGTDAVPDAAANWVEARNLSLTPLDAETVDRNLALPYMGNSGKISVAQWVKASLEIAVAGSGTAGTAPKHDALLLACGMAKTLTEGTSVIYNLVSTGFGAVSMYINVDGVQHQMIGARGTVGVSMSAKQIPVFKFEFDAAFVDPSAVVMPVVNRSGWPIEEAVNAENTSPLTINGVDLGFSALELALNNERKRLSLPGPQTGVEISDRKPSGNATVLAPALTVFDPFALVKAGATLPISVTHGTAAGKKVKVDAKVVVIGSGYDEIEGMTGYKLDMEPTPVSGNDELAFTFF